MSPEDDDLFQAGHIIGAFGVRGQVKVFSHTSPRENIVTYSPWILEHHGVRSSMAVTGNRQGKHVVARLEGIVSRDQAEELAAATIYIHRDQLSPLQEGEYYWTQLEGLQVINAKGDDFGVIDHMMETGANDVMVVQGDRERLIPFVMDEVVVDVDLDMQQVVVEWEVDY